VLYAGRFGREKGILELLSAMARSEDQWPLHLVGAGPLRRAIEERIDRLGLGERVEFLPFLSDRLELARAYAEASCVVMPGAFETFGLVAFEAAASGGRVVACKTAPSAKLVGGLAETFRPGNVAGLECASTRARSREVDLAAAAALAERFTWERALAAELADLERLVQ
jgi:alpha-1,6-mannosyltransferase